MAKHLVKCLYCDEQFDTNTTEYVKPKANRYAHKSCADRAAAAKSKEQEDKEKLEAYIKQLFNITTLTPKITQQIKTFHETNGYGYSGMRKTLQYFFDVRKSPIEKANGGIGIIPYVWEEARKYWKSIEETQEKNRQVDVQQFILPVREITIKSPQREPMRHMRKLFSFLDEG